jgi:hypothetical protein
LFSVDVVVDAEYAERMEGARGCFRNTEVKPLNEGLIGGLGAKRGDTKVGVKGVLSEGVGESLWFLEIQLDDEVAADFMNRVGG